MEEFNKAIRTTQLSGGGILVEAEIYNNGIRHYYRQSYADMYDNQVKDIPEAVQKFEDQYLPIYLKESAN